MIESSEKHIANGDNIDEFPVATVLIVSAVAFVGMILAVVFIVAHKKKHHAYVHGVTTGQIQPLTPGMPAQAVTMTAVAPTVAPIAMNMPIQPVAAVEQPFTQPSEPLSAPIVPAPMPLPSSPTPVPLPTAPIEPTVQKIDVQAPPTEESAQLPTPPQP
jgi:hypothetical protein